VGYKNKKVEGVKKKLRNKNPFTLKINEK